MIDVCEINHLRTAGMKSSEEMILAVVNAIYAITKEGWKKIQDFNGVWKRDDAQLPFAGTVMCSSLWLCSCFLALSVSSVSWLELLDVEPNRLAIQPFLFEGDDDGPFVAMATHCPSLPFTEGKSSISVSTGSWDIKQVSGWVQFPQVISFWTRPKRKRQREKLLLFFLILIY